MSGKPAFEVLADVLRQRLVIIKDAELRQRDPDGQLRRLGEVSEEILRAQAALPKPIDPQLAHYLQRSSYDKALAWLEAASGSKLPLS